MNSPAVSFGSGGAVCAFAEGLEWDLLRRSLRRKHEFGIIRKKLEENPLTFRGEMKSQEKDCYADT